MTPDSSRDRVVIVISDPSRVDLEWVLPLIDELASDGVNLDVIDFSAPVPTDDSNYWMRALRLIGHEPMLSADLEPIPRFLARALDWMRSSRHRPIALIGASYFSPKSPLNGLFPFTRWREARRRRRLGDLMASTACVFTRLREEDMAPEMPEGEFLEIARRNDVPVIGYPPVIDHIRSHRTLMNCDVALANTAPQAKTLPVGKQTRAIAVTPPKFTRRWLDRINQLQQRLSDPIKLPENRERTLVILKNDTSVVWKGLGFLETTRHLIDRLMSDGSYLVLKPHPRQSPAALDKLLDGLDPNDYCTVDGPLSYWAQRVDKVVSLFSGGVLDVLAVGKVPVLYWPLTDSYLDQIRADNVPEKYARLDDSCRLVTRYGEFCHEVTSPNYQPPQSPDDSQPIRRFRALYPMAPDCRETKALIPVDRQEREQLHEPS